MNWDMLESRIKPKPYTGFLIKNASDVDSGFNHDKFMKSFAVLQESREVVRTYQERLVFSVVKLEKIIIQRPAVVELVEAIRSCDKLDPPEPDRAYFMNNREYFLHDIRSMLSEYENSKDVSCENLKKKFSPLPHQLRVKEYININTPYRGLLLYHGLGSGKTCSAITIAEGIKPYTDIVVMTPASLKMNFMQELKKCGDSMYRVNQHWKWSTSPTRKQMDRACLPDHSNGMWINSNDPPNFSTLSEEYQDAILAQIDVMIEKKYKFISYNGINRNNFKKIIGKNVFSNKLVIIDEAHNFVSRIVNKLKQPESLSMQLYKKIMEAENCKIIMLTGTPMINYAHEIAILFNMLRGYIPAWSCTGSTIQETEMRSAFPNMDTFSKTANSITITCAPEGFQRTTNSTAVSHINAKIDLDEKIRDYFATHKGKNVQVVKYTALPETEDAFNDAFVKDGDLVNKYQLQCRLTGLASYFGDVTELMPELRPTIMHYVKMSDRQLAEYDEARKNERKLEKPRSGKTDELASTYRIVSRLICNTTYPEEVRAKRPTNLTAEIAIKKGEDEEEEEEVKTKNTVEDFFSAIDASNYCTQLQLYSPKYIEILKTVQLQEKNRQLLYSQFINIEGIKLFAKVLNANDYAEFKIKKTGSWDIDVHKNDMNKKMYIIYGGTALKEDAKEVLRNIFNKNWDEVPDHVSRVAKKLDIVLFMITSAGAEGISLKGVQYVHIMEPYWNPIRLEQVIGRARRICSHNELAPRERFVQVHMYITIFPTDFKKFLDLQADIVDGKPGTTDEYLINLASTKKIISTSINNCIKQASIDYFLHNKSELPSVNEQKLIYHADMTLDETTDARTVGTIKKARSRIMSKKGILLYEYDNEIEDGFSKLYKDDEFIGYMTRKPAALFQMDKKTPLK